jgi:hypothetical protein
VALTPRAATSIVTGQFVFRKSPPDGGLTAWEPAMLRCHLAPCPHLVPGPALMGRPGTSADHPGRRLQAISLRTPWWLSDPIRHD